MNNKSKLFKNIRLVFYRAFFEFKLEASRMHLGNIWWVAAPLIDMMIFYLVFGILRHREGEFMPFLLIGIVFWRLYSQVFLRGIVSISNGMKLARQCSISKIVFPLITMTKLTLQFLFSLVLLVVVLLINNFYPSIYWLGFFEMLIILYLFILGTTLPFAAITPFFPDLQLLFNNTIRLMFYMSGIFFDYKEMPKEYQIYLVWNPMLHIIEGFRDVLMDKQWPDTTYLGPIALISLAFTLTGVWLINRYDGIYAKRIVQ